MSGCLREVQGPESLKFCVCLQRYILHECQMSNLTFASLSYDGRLVVNKVPSHTKYKVCFDCKVHVDPEQVGS